MNGVILLGLMSTEVRGRNILRYPTVSDYTRHHIAEYMDLKEKQISVEKIRHLTLGGAVVILYTN